MPELWSGHNGSLSNTMTNHSTKGWKERQNVYSHLPHTPTLALPQRTETESTHAGSMFQTNPKILARCTIICQHTEPLIPRAACSQEQTWQGTPASRVVLLNFSPQSQLQLFLLTFRCPGLQVVAEWPNWHARFVYVSKNCNHALIYIYVCIENLD
jgi:hypothetical protein